jgi:hypothetical protein
MQHISNLTHADGSYVLLDNGEKLMISKAQKEIFCKN